MPDISVTLTDAERANLKLIINCGVKHGVEDGQPMPSLRAAGLIWPALMKIELAEIEASKQAPPCPSPAP